jgi:Zn-dependent protease with chaperone function|tara:strand:+ start:1705 stop:2277 length:573 start_codon:yes stop_codon:yes gene_type:complete
MLVLEQISTSVLVGPKQLPHVHKLVLDAAEVLDIPPPQLYIRQSSQPNAYTLAISGREPVVVVHTALIELMSAAELQAVIAHEMGHLKCDHGVWLTVANLLTLGVEIAPLVPTFVVDNFRDNLMRWVRAAELSCDRAALIVAGDPKVVVSVLMKLSGGCPKLSGQLNVDAFLDQARRYVYFNSCAYGKFV